jgi:hypothetical protein
MTVVSTANAWVVIALIIAQDKIFIVRTIC